MKRRNQAESVPQREVPRLTFAEVRFDENLQEVIQRAADHLLSLQAPEGFWVGELEADNPSPDTAADGDTRGVPPAD